jgi:hypothetical protein
MRQKHNCNYISNLFFYFLIPIYTPVWQTEMNFADHGSHPPCYYVSLLYYPYYTLLLLLGIEESERFGATDLPGQATFS